jgi:hypothetical protein
MPVHISEVQTEVNAPDGAQAPHADDPRFIRAVTERVWQLWREEARREAERRGKLHTHEPHERGLK